MNTCALCKKKIDPGTKAVSLVGGFFLVDEPNFFAMDETVMPESYTHLGCLLRRTAEKSNDVVSLDCKSSGGSGEV